jgi:hypothetical protein
MATSVPFQPTADEWITQGKSWFQHCEVTHAHRCPKMLQKLPTRVVHVGDDLNNPYLYESDLNEVGTYACLSYVWGQNQPFLTTTGTFEKRQNGFKLDLLPRTIRDAVIFTRGLGLKFLWVDSICIIQDSIQDWTSEAAKMCSVYSKAAVTFAAMDSPDSNSGLFVGGPNRYTVKVDLQAGPVYFRCHTHGTPGSEPHPQNLPPFDNNEPPILTTRGWTLQELILSPRVLWCRRSELGWSCLSEKACECAPEPSANDHDVPYEDLDGLTVQFQSQSIPEDNTKFLKLWAELVDTYGRRKLSKEADRLPALAGLAEMFQRKINCRYLFGLWDTNLESQLLWTSANVPWMENEKLEPHKFVPRLPDDYAPSWSWARCQGQVSLWESMDHNRSVYYPNNESNSGSGAEDFEWEIKGVEIWPSGTNIFGPGSGHLTLETLMVPVEYHRENSQRGAMILYSGSKPAFRSTHKSLCLLIQGSTDGWLSFDFRLSSDKKNSLECIDMYFAFAKIGNVYEGSEEYYTLFGLLLMKISEDEDHYMRIAACGDVRLELSSESSTTFSVGNSLQQYTTGSLRHWKQLGKRKTIVIV